MPVVQISQIKHRRGTNENLPQLASAELGWSVDTQQLYIGNGTLEEGAPEVGNTEILTEHSDIPGVPTTDSATLVYNTTTNVSITTDTVLGSENPGAQIEYVITRGSDIRTGILRVTQYLTNLAYDDEYTETADIGVTLNFTQVANNYAQLSATVGNASPYAGINANLQCRVSTFTF